MNTIDETSPTACSSSAPSMPTRMKWRFSAIAGILLARTALGACGPRSVQTMRAEGDCYRDSNVVASLG